MRGWLRWPLHPQLVSLLFGCSGYYEGAFQLFGRASGWPSEVLGIRKASRGWPLLAFMVAYREAVSKMKNNVLVLICLVACSCSQRSSTGASRTQSTNLVQIASVIALPEELKHLDALFLESGLHAEIWGDRIYSVSVPLKERDLALQLLRSDVATNT